MAQLDRPDPAPMHPATPPEALIAPKRLARVAVGELREHPMNPRVSDMDALADSIEAHGVYRPIAVQASTMIVVAGWHTLQAAIAAGEGEVDVTLEDITDDEALAAVLADNRTGDLGTYDEAALLFALAEADEADQLAATGYDRGDVDELVGKAQRAAWREAEQERRAGEAPADLRTAQAATTKMLPTGAYTFERAGEAFTLLVADEEGFYPVGASVRLMERVALVVARVLPCRAVPGVLQVSPEAAATVTAFLLAPGRAFFVDVLPCPVPGAGHPALDVLFAMGQEGSLSHRQTLVVTTPAPVLAGEASAGLQDWVQLRHTVAHYGWRSGAPHVWHGGRDQTSVFDSFELGLDACRDGALSRQRLMVATEKGETVVELGAADIRFAEAALAAGRCPVLMATSAASGALVAAEALGAGFASEAALEALAETSAPDALAH